MSNFEKHKCQKLWARKKYSVLAKSQKVYREIREYLKLEHPNLVVLKSMIDGAANMPDDIGTVANAIEHVWGYFKKSAAVGEKSEFLRLLSGYTEGVVEKEMVLAYLYTLLGRYPNVYLQDSDFFDSVKQIESVELEDL